MKTLFSIWIPVCLIAVLSMARADEERPVVEFELDALRWKNRVLILFAPSESDPAFQLQKQELASRSEGVFERDLTILDILEDGESRAGNILLSEKAAEKIRLRFGVRAGHFQVFLIGKDGTVKLHSEEPVSAKDIFGLIDSMPMRRREMDSKRESSF